MTDRSPEFIKVSQGDARNQKVGVREIKPINNIKVVRDHESDVSSISSYSSEGSEDSAPRKKKTKKVLRKKESVPQGDYQQKYDYSAFSNPKKISASRREPDSESEYSDESSYASSEASGESDESGGSGEEQPQTNSFEEKQKMKQDLLIKIAAMEKKGFEFTKKFTMNSNYEEMMFEYNKVKSFIESQASIKFARRCLMACVTGIEFLNKKFDPFNIKLEGWSENVMESVDDYDNVFERLREKYASSAEVAPEVELLLMLGGSAFMFHLTNSLLKSPAMGNIINSNFGQGQGNQNFMANMMGAMSQGMKEMNKPPGMAQQQPSGMTPPMETRGIRKEMRGPSLDPNLFHGTPLASNYPSPPPPMNFQQQPPPRFQREHYYDDNPIRDDDRFSIASSDDSDISSVSMGSTVKTLNIGGKKKVTKKGVELNIR